MKICIRLILTKKDELKEKQVCETSWSFIPRCTHYISANFNKTDSEKLIQIIDKINHQANPKLDVIVRYFKRDDLDCLIDNGWVVTNVDVVLPSAELYKFIEDSGFEGVTLREIQEKWPHIKISNLPITNLQYGGKIVIGSGPESDSKSKYKIEHTFVIKEYMTANRNYWTRMREGNKPPIDIVEKPKPPKINKLSKSKQRECRKSVIDKATANDFNKYGFTDDFIDALSDDEKSYVLSLDDFKTKLLFNAIGKAAEVA